ncbi:MAG: MATE family efflux transporter [Pseudomonadota bacterium]
MAEVFAPGDKSRRARLWQRDAKALAVLGTPMALTQLVQFSVHTIDVMMIGRLGPDALAGASLGLVMFYAGWLSLFGPAMAISPMVSQALGRDADDVQDVRRSVRMGLWAVGIASPFFIIVYFFATDIALFFGQPEKAAKLAGPYVLAIAPGLPFSLGILILRNYLAALDKTRVPLYVVIGTTALNALLNYLLIFGALGAPRLELVGAGIASAVSNAVGFAALVVYARWEPSSARFQLFKRFWVIDRERLKEVAILGLPISLTTAFEGMLFNACVFLMGRIGIVEVAAYQVALNVAAVAFMAPMGFSMAGAVRVGLAAGAGDQDAVRRTSVLTIGFAVGAIMLIAIPVILVPRLAAGLYMDLHDPGNEAILEEVSLYLKIAAAFMLFDAVQVAANQCLRGLKDVRIPMVATAVSYWLIGFPLAAYLGLKSPLGAVGVWWGLLVSLFVAAILLSARLWQLTRSDSHARPA